MICLDEEIARRYEKLGHRGGLGEEINYRVVRPVI